LVDDEDCEEDCEEAERDEQGEQVRVEVLEVTMSDEEREEEGLEGAEPDSQGEGMEVSRDRGEADNSAGRGDGDEQEEEEACSVRVSGLHGLEDLSIQVMMVRGG
jgi:hypothetical protein